MINSFDTEVAMHVGINAAVIYRNIQYWCEKNRTNEMNEHEGLFWTYNSIKAFCKQFPYLTEKQIRSSLKLLEEKGYIKSGNFNKSSYDRTKWYADLMPKMSDSNCLVGQMENDEKANGNALDGEPIPNINTDNINTDINKIYISADESFFESLPDKPVAEVVDEKEKMFLEFWELYPKKVDKEGCRKAFKRIKKLKEVFPEIIRALEIQKQSKQWNKENGQYIPNPRTYINQERWLSVNEADEIQAIQDQLVMDSLNEINFYGGENNA